jgi:Spy/CpxP family protein refolding chaperone
MKKRIGLLSAVSLSAFFFAASTLPVRAQGTTSNAQKLEKLEALSKQLNLTPEQKAKLLPILKAEAPKMQAIKENSSLTKMQKVEQIRALHEQTNPQVQAILTPQQFQQLQEIRRQEVETMIQKKRAEQQ